MKTTRRTARTTYPWRTGSDAQMLKSLKCCNRLFCEGRAKQPVARRRLKDISEIGIMVENHLPKPASSA
jgi:hypothetical protein